jgi:hypothetical protein
MRLDGFYRAPVRLGLLREPLPRGLCGGGVTRMSCIPVPYDVVLRDLAQSRAEGLQLGA